MPAFLFFVFVFLFTLVHRDASADGCESPRRLVFCVLALVDLTTKKKGSGTQERWYCQTLRQEAGRN